jgi:uncharacterized protein YbjT (DUF2867 family)
MSNPEADRSQHEAPSKRRVVVLGASGYVGGRLVSRLLDEGHQVVATSRDRAKLTAMPWADRVEIRSVDLLDEHTIGEAIAGCDAAYYLVHAMGGGEGFAGRDRTAALNLVAASHDSDLQQIIYLSGLGHEDAELSEHLASRQEVGQILAAGTVPVTELRAAIVIGSGSLSFEMLRYLTEVLPVMITPRWVRTRCQPIAIADVLHYLAAVLGHPEADDRILEIGGPDVLTYEEMIRAYARIAGLKPRRIIPVPVLSPGLSGRWIGLVTPLSSVTSEELVQSLRNEVIVRDRPISDIIEHETLGFEESVQRALERVKNSQVPTRWSPEEWAPAQPLPSDPGYASGTVLTDVRRMDTCAAPEDLFWAFARVGGATGYYSAAWAWQIRGLIDQVLGGAGLRRGRRDPEEVRPGEPLDFWRVVEVRPNEHLTLKAEMKVPGEAWLEWDIEEHDGRFGLIQRATFVPRGLFGRLYWYSLVPFHGFVFPQMARGIVSAAEERWDARDAERAG